MTKKTKLKNALNAISISISICTILSALLYYLFGRGSFQLINPYTMTLSNQIYNAFISLILYVLTGLYFYYFIILVKNEHLGFNKYTFIHFVVSIIAFSIVGFLSGAPLGTTKEAFSAYYAEGAWFNLLVYPIVITLIGYFVAYILIWIYYRYQVKQINNKINSHK